MMSSGPRILANVANRLLLSEELTKDETTREGVFTQPLNFDRMLANSLLILFLSASLDLPVH